MLRRLAVVLVSAAVSVPLSSPASASCADDLAATDPTAGYTYPSGSYSPYWDDKMYAEASGATVTIHGNELVADATFHAGAWVRYTTIVAGNVTRATTTFIDCVAG